MIVAFWNVNKNCTIDNLIFDLLYENKVDILILAEYENDIDELCKKLNTKIPRFKPLQSVSIGCDRIKGIYNSRYSQRPLFANTRCLITSFSTSYFKIIFGMIHAHSNLHKTDNDRIMYFSKFYKDVENCESELDTYNTIILGDFNSNPFDHSIISAGALHAIPYKEEAAKLCRTVDEISYKTFYNPSWKLIAQNTPPYGTYYYNSSDCANYFWNIYDQVIIRPNLIKAFVDDSLRIITKIKNKTLLKDEYKPNKNYSDHLPIVFEIKEEKIK